MGSRPQPPSELTFRDTTFLVVDDKPVFRDLMRTALAGRVAGIKDAASVEKAIDILNQPGHEIGCVVCDWDIHPLGGLELLRMIRCGAVANASPLTCVTILTARADASAVKAAMELDVNGFAIAPLSFEKLLKTISLALTRRWLLQRPAHYTSVSAAIPPSANRDSLTKAEPPATPLGYGKPFARRSNGGLMNVRVCALDDIQPGAVLARDLRDNRGHLLLGTGTELKPAILSRLKHAARWRAENYEVWVGEHENRL